MEWLNVVLTKKSERKTEINNHLERNYSKFRTDEVSIRS